MPEDTHESTYEIEFDERGRIRIRDSELAHRLLRLAGGKEGIEIVIDARPVRNSSKEWGLPLPTINSDACPKPHPMNLEGCPVPPPIDGSGCPNSMCPFSATLRISRPVVEQWEREAGLE